MPDEVERTELGLELTVTDQERELRGTYDASRTPEAVKRLVCFLLAVPGMRWDAVAKHAGMAWETVAAIAKSRPDAIRDFKGRLAGNLALVIEASTPGLLQRASRGEISPFELKLLTETWALIAGEATSRHEVVTSSPELDDLRRLLSVRTVQETGGAGREDFPSGGAGNAGALADGAAAGAALPTGSAVAGQVIDAEVVVTNHQLND